jgi:tight adherence protein B
MGAVVGLLFGLGVLLIWHGGTGRPARRGRSGPRLRDRLDELLAQAGLPMLRHSHLVAACVAIACLVFVLVAVVSRSTIVPLAFAAFAAYLPVAWVKLRRQKRSVELRELWPDVVDNLTSSVRAGLSLPEAVAQIGARGPEPLRAAFMRFADDYRASGRFSESLDRLKARLADPVADRIVESLRVAREVGGHDLGRLLRTLSQFLRDDARTRAEVEARQAWTVNAARLAMAAPWAVLGMLALRPEAVAAYDSALGVVVLVAGAGVSLVAYRVMVRIARLPAEERVLR